MSIYDFIRQVLQISIIRSAYLCRLRTFILNFSTVTSAWILVLIGLNRLIRARLPYQQGRICTQKTVSLAVTFVCLFSIVFTCHVLQTQFAFIFPTDTLCGPARFPLTVYSKFYHRQPELIADVLGRSKAENYRKPTDLVNIVKPIIGVHNLLVSEGQEHERARKMLNPAFHFVKLQSMVPIISNETSKAIDSLLQFASLSNEINFGIQFNALTLSIIASSAFGQSFETIPHAKELMCYLFNEVKEVISYRTIRMINQVKFLAELPFWGKDIVDNGARKLNEFVNQAIADRRNEESRSLCSGQDILDLLLSAIDDKGESFSDQQIKDEALTFILAGHETTGSLMTWALYILMTDDNVLKACREEIDRILPKETIPTYEHMADLHVIEAVLHETLRLYPPAPFFVRECIKEHIIGSKNSNDEIHVPVGAMIVIHSYALHRREQYWPRPLEFDYKRWIRDPITGLKPKLAHPYAYLPFAAGPRNCIGQNFALLEAKVMLAMFVQRCDFELIPGQKFAPEMKV